MAKLRFVLVFIAVLLFLLPLWIWQTFGNSVTTEQLVYHVMSGTRQLAGANNPIVLSFIFINIVTPSLVAYGSYVADIRAQRKISHVSSSKNSKKLPWLASASLTLLAVALVVASAVSFSERIGIPAYIKSFSDVDAFSAVYFHPENIQFAKPIKKKNLLLLYVESLEYGLRSEDLHGINLIKPIDDLPGQNVKVQVAPGTNWSIAGMVASQCSVPLKAYLGNNMGSKIRFLPSLTCIGDILAEQGYQQYFLTGPKLKFSGLDTFYGNHGFQLSIGRDEWRKRGLSPDLFDGWGEGIHDDTLLDEAKKIMVEARATNQPFNMTLITTDNHAPDGTTSPRCKDTQFNEGFRRAFKCNSEYVANFINDLDKAKLLDNTLVVIMGDHPFMNSPEIADVFPNPREVYLKIMNANRKVERESMTHFDVAPSILQDLGILEGQGGKFGLGISNFTKVSEQDYSTHLGKVTDHSITNHSSTYDKFWMPKI